MHATGSPFSRLGGRDVETASGLGAVDRARLALAGALVTTPALLMAREIDRALDGGDAATVLALLPPAHRERLAVLATAASLPA